MTTFASSVRAVLFSAPEVGPIHLKRDALLSQQNRQADAVYLIETGLVKLTRKTNQGSRRILCVIGPHQFAGDESLSDAFSSYTADAECLMETVAYRIPLTTLRRLFGIPEFAIAMVSYAVGIRELYSQMAALMAGRDVEFRLLYGLAILAELVRPIPGEKPGENLYPIPMTQAEIASFIGATRETTSTILGQLQLRKLVTLGRRRIMTVNPELLRKAAEGNLTKGAP